MKWILYTFAGLAGLLVLGCAVLLGLGARSGACTMHASTVIDKPAAEVWPWLKEPGKLKRWVSWLVEVEENGDARQVWVMEDRNNGNQHMRIESTFTVQEPPSRLVYETSVADQFRGEQVIVLTPENGGRTRVDFNARYTLFSPVAKLLEPVITPQAQKKLDMDLAMLKQQVEAAR